MCDQPLPIDQELILFGFAAEDGVILKDQTLHALAGLALEEQRGGQSADSAADDHTIVSFPGINDIVRRSIVNGITNGVAGLQNIPSVAVRGAVFADSAVAGEFVSLHSKQFSRRCRPEQRSTGSQHRGTEEITTGNLRFHAERCISRLARRVTGHRVGPRLHLVRQARVRRKSWGPCARLYRDRWTWKPIQRFWNSPLPWYFVTRMVCTIGRLSFLQTSQ